MKCNWRSLVCGRWARRKENIYEYRYAIVGAVEGVGSEAPTPSFYKGKIMKIAVVILMIICFASYVDLKSADQVIEVTKLSEGSMIEDIDSPKVLRTDTDPLSWFITNLDNIDLETEHWRWTLTGPRRMALTENLNVLAIKVGPCNHWINGDDYEGWREFDQWERDLVAREHNDGRVWLLAIGWTF